MARRKLGPATIVDHMTSPEAHPKVLSVITGATGNVHLDFGAFDAFDITMVGNCTFIVDNPPPVGDLHAVEIIFRQDATGSRLATFPSAGGTAWLFSGGSKTLTTTASAIDKAIVRSDPSVVSQQFLAELTKAYA